MEHGRSPGSGKRLRLCSIAIRLAPAPFGENRIGARSAAGPAAGEAERVQALRGRMIDLPQTRCAVHWADVPVSS